MVSVISFLISLASCLLTVPEVKFDETRWFLIVVFRAPIYILLSVFDVDTKRSVNRSSRM